MRPSRRGQPVGGRVVSRAAANCERLRAPPLFSRVLFCASHKHTNTQTHKHTNTQTTHHNQKRLDCAYHSVTAMVGAGVLGLPGVLSTLGWGGGLAALAFSLFVSW